MANINKIQLPNGTQYDIEDAVARANIVDTLSALSDTTITSPIDGQVLTYDGTTDKWVNATADASFDVQIVQTLPTTNIDTHTIYFVPVPAAVVGTAQVGSSAVGSENDVYDEYMYINNQWEKIGDTRIDLSGYATEDYVDAAIVQSDWAENDSTDPAYIQNRTHYATNHGYILTVDFMDYVGSESSYSYTFDDINKTYSNVKNIIELVNNFTEEYFPTNSLADIDITKDPVVTVNGEEIELSTSYLQYSEYWEDSVFYAYNDNICILYEGTDYNNLIFRLYYNSTIGELTSVVVDLPLTNEILEPIKTLDSIYLNGKLIKKGTGRYSEIFNDHNDNIASGYMSHSEGRSTAANGAYSHAEGFYTTASGASSHAECNNTTASGVNSHAEGYYTIASGDYSHAEGQGGYVSNIKLTGEINTTTYTVTNNVYWRYSLERLKQCTIYNWSSDIVAKIISATISQDYKIQSVTLSQTINPENSFDQEGCGLYNYTVASGTGSHAEGSCTWASLGSAHAEGSNTIAAGANSHAQNTGTIASKNSQTAIGRYNIEDTATSSDGTYALIVGNGTNSSNRSNAHTLDWQGNGTFAGKVTVGAAPVNDMDVATKQYVDQNTSDQVMIVNITRSGTTYSADKTHAEILAHINAGNVAVCAYDGYYYNLLMVKANDYISFVYTIIDDETTGWSDKVYIHTDNTVTTDYSEIYQAISSLSDANISSPSNGQILAYNGTSRKWENSAIPAQNGSLSISSNVITLTNASGQTSSITLPVYSGAVSGGAS